MVLCYTVPALWWRWRGGQPKFAFPAVLSVFFATFTQNGWLLLAAVALAFTITTITRPPLSRRPRRFARLAAWALMGLAAAVAAGIPTAIRDNPIPAYTGAGYGWEVVAYGWWAGIVVLGIGWWRYRSDMRTWDTMEADREANERYVAVLEEAAPRVPPAARSRKRPGSRPAPQVAATAASRTAPTSVTNLTRPTPTGPRPVSRPAQRRRKGR